ncbi:MAG TPA: carboxypeptidase-like regulatory domain-containing protein [Bacteroidia bacterium]|nr:outer membrane beta-barrel protein [Bacteroidia bacterium]HRD37808.1 carboxypeptidase-like regulatory domain-containing protein [Bacteroidia bacterium]
MKRILSALTLLISITAYSQTGKITGKIIDAKTGETLPGATAVIEGTTKGASADFDGNFSLNNVPVGKVTLIVSYISYDTKKLTGIEVKANDVTNVNVPLETSSSQNLQEVTVTVEIAKENTAALVLMQKNNVSVSDGVSAETIKRTPDRNTADVLKRVSGVTIIEDKFVIVRGLSDRYNVSFLNNSPLPNTEADKKAFSFDIFPANMLDNILVNKTATPDMPGDFAGGIIQINTKNIPDKNFVSLSLNGGYNTITTGKEQLTYQGGKRDWLGIDDGTRALPSETPTQENFPADNISQFEAAKPFKNDWAIEKSTFKPNFSTQFAIGQNIKYKERDFIGILFSLTYNNSNTFAQRTRNVYNNNATGTGESVQEEHYDLNVYGNQNLLGSILNLSFKLNENNNISLKNIYSISSDDKLIASLGNRAMNEEIPIETKINSRFFQSSKVYSGQLSGDHYLPKLKIKGNWVGSYGTSNRNVPNYRVTAWSRQTKLTDPNEPYLYDTIYQANVALSTSGPDYSGYRFYSNLDENIKSFKADFSRGFKISENLKQEIKVGGFAQTRDREFYTRQLGLTHISYMFKNSLLYLPEDQIFAQQNMGLNIPSEVGYPDSTGFKLSELTKPTDKYSATSKLFAGYLMLDTKYKEWFRVIYGVRFENFFQKVNAERIKGVPLVIERKNLDFLPSINLIFSLNEKQNIRASYSKTVNRPEFRELAPFNWYDPETRFLLSGREDLVKCDIQNYDLRYEVYPGRGQILSASAFYKDFKNPIEIVASENASDELVFKNTPKATIIGAELEFRVIIGALFKTDSIKFLNNLSVFSNLSYFKSEVSLFKPGSTTEKYTRSLQGQSPYIINAGILYNDNELGFSVGAMLNRIGERIYNVGTQNEPNRWENSRTVVDIQFGKQLWKNRMEIKFNIRDLLKQRSVIYQNNDNDTRFNKGKDYEVLTRTYGTVYSLQLNIKL